MDEYVFHPLEPQDAVQTWQDLQAAYAKCGGHLKYPAPAAPPESGVKLGTVVPIQRHWLVTVGRFSASATTLEAGKALVEKFADEGGTVPVRVA